MRLQVSALISSLTKVGAAALVPRSTGQYPGLRPMSRIGLRADEQ